MASSLTGLLRPFMPTQGQSETSADTWEPALVVAIDIGTYASGYVMQWRSDYKTNRLKMDVNTRWSKGGLCTWKTPTCLLLRPDKSTADFGYAAETTYCDLKEDGENPDNWYFFRNFKMILYRADGNIDVDTQIEGADMKHLSAKLVFSRCIEYMVNHVKEHLRACNLPYREADTKWVISVPAIFADRAKAIVGAAAQEAGIKRNKLSLAIEPECAAIYCSQLPRDQLEIQGDGGRLKYVAAPGSIIAVVDMGGGSVDITIVSMNTDNTMQPVFSSGGGPWGGMQVNDRFQDFLLDIIGQDVLQQFAVRYRSEEYDLRTEFENCKREIKHSSEPGANNPCKIKLPGSLTDLWMAARDGRTVADILRDRRDLADKNVRFSGGRLIFDSRIVREFFDEAVGDIIGYIKNTLTARSLRGFVIDAMVVVGGFSMSSHVIHKLRDGLASRGIPVVRPLQPELAVLSGAVLFGQNEHIISSRIMNHTYGVGVARPFDDTKHRDTESTKFISTKGRVWANLVFSKHVTRGDSVKLGQWTRDQIYQPDHKDQTKTTVYVYTSNSHNPVHTNEAGCLCIGQFDVHFPRSSNRTVAISLNFSGTQVRVRGVVSGTNRHFEKCLTLR